MSKESIEELFELHREKMYKKTDEISEITKQIISNSDNLMEKLSEEDWKCVNEIMELQNVRSGMVQKEVFIYAFSLAIKLFAEGLSKDE